MLKSYYEQKLSEFKEKYPKEYELNFASEYEPTCPSDCKGVAPKRKKFSIDKSNEKSKSIELSYKNNGKSKPEMSAKIDGNKVNDDKLTKIIDDLCKDPEIEYLAKLLGIV